MAIWHTIVGNKRKERKKCLNKKQRKKENQFERYNYDSRDF
jgi:hypothetical protein